MKSTCAFRERCMKATQTAASTQISHFDLVFHKVQREGQLGIILIFAVFGGAPMWFSDACGAHVVHVSVYGASMHTCVFGDACMCIWCIYMHL